jgi:hypothetical protein
VNALAINFYRQLTVRETEKVADKAILSLSLKFAQLEPLIKGVFEDKIKPSNLEKVHTVFKYFGSSAFMRAFFNGANMSDARADFKRHITAIMLRELREADLVPPPRLCREKSCRDEAAFKNGAFEGSPFCAKHHAEQLKQYAANPSVVFFLWGAGCEYAPVMEVIDTKAPANTRAFLFAIRNFMDAPERVRRVFCVALYDKYLHPNAAQHKLGQGALSPECVAAIAACYESGSVDVYAAAYADLLALLEKLFAESVMNTPTLSRYLETKP